MMFFTSLREIISTGVRRAGSYNSNGTA
jgi:hypothetical protein